MHGRGLEKASLESQKEKSIRLANKLKKEYIDCEASEFRGFSCGWAILNDFFDLEMEAVFPKTVHVQVLEGKVQLIDEREQTLLQWKEACEAVWELDLSFSASDVTYWRRDDTERDIVTIQSHGNTNRPLLEISNPRRNDVFEQEEAGKADPELVQKKEGIQHTYGNVTLFDRPEPCHRLEAAALRNNGVGSTRRSASWTRPARFCRTSWSPSSS